VPFGVPGKAMRVALGGEALFTVSKIDPAASAGPAANAASTPRAAVPSNRTRVLIDQSFRSQVDTSQAVKQSACQSWNSPYINDLQNPQEPPAANM
jgi:hypothetical protein